MYTSFAYLILLLHINTWCLAQEAEATPISEICDYLEEHADHTTVTPFTIDSTLDSQSITCVHSYSVLISTQTQSSNYLIIEIQQADSIEGFDTILVTNTQSRPEIWYNNSERILNETYDVNAYVYKKNYQHITYNPSDLSIGKKIYFSIYHLPIEDGTPLAPAIYTIKVRSAAAYPCPKSCSTPSSGYCDENLKKCICNPGYFDEDCSVQATALSADGSISSQMPVNEYRLYYFEVLNSANDFQFSYSKTVGEIAFSFTINKHNDFNLPNYDGRIISNMPGYNATKAYYNIFQQALSYKSVLLLEVYNIDPTATVTFQATIGTFVDPAPDRNTLMVILLGTSAFLVISWGVLTLVKFKHHRIAETLLQNRNPNGPQQNDLLSKEDLDRFFKKLKMKEIKSSFPQNVCSICLEDFHGESVVRQLYCEHAYHATCIESWLSQHNSCPNCKKDMTKSAIEEYLASPKLLDEVKEEEEMERNNLGSQSNRGRMGLPRGVAPLEEIKEDYARSLNDIIIQHKDERMSKKLSESLTGPPLERKGSSLRSTPKYLEPRPGFGNRKIDEMYRKNTQDPMDFEERDVREKSDMNNSIMMRMNQWKSRNISEINPLNRRSIEKNPDDEDSRL